MNSNALHVTVSILILSYCENIIKIESTVGENTIATIKIRKKIVTL